MITYEMINICANTFSLFTMLMLLLGTVLGGNLREKINFWFLILLISCLLGILAEWATFALIGSTGKTALTFTRIIDYCGHVLGSIQIILYAKYMYEYLSTKNIPAKKDFYFIACWSIPNFIIATIAQFTNLYGYYDDQNIFQPASTYWVAIIFYIIFQVVYLIVVLKNKKSLKTREWLSLASYAIVSFIIYTITWCIPALWVVYLGPTISMFLIYINIQVEIKQQLNESRMAIMLSQIQPHFLYNSLTAISGQCKNSPEAQESILSFSEYLRGNMESLSKTTPVPFDDELKHTQQYLDLEKLRFGDSLNIEFDIETTDFMLPVLTLQPIVENAVRHGVTQQIHGGTVLVKVDETKHCYRIVVTDDGVGFNPNEPPQDDVMHVGVENVRMRLATMCGGSLAINSTPGTGTTATIEIPKP